MSKKILLVPSDADGNGLGHIKRCYDLASKLTALQPVFWSRRKDGPLKAVVGGSFPVLTEPEAKGFTGPVLLDNRESSRRFAGEFAGTVIGLDEGGEARKYLPFLIDTLPGLPGRQEPNMDLFSLNISGPFAHPFKKVLVSFGGEDKEDLSSVMLKALLEEELFFPEDITVVQGPGFTRDSWPPGVKVLKAPGSLEAVTSAHDLVITHFGLTCFEAVRKGKGVILLNPSEYHRKLALSLKLPEVGVKIPHRRRLRQWIADPELWTRLSVDLSKFTGKKEELENLLLSLDIEGGGRCRSCGETGPVLYRTGWRTYYECSRCGLIYMVHFRVNRESYGKDYFFSEYKNQYGKTYLEDFDHIKEMARRRLGVIRGLIRKAGEIKLLDIGCAYGPFLKAADEAGFTAAGAEISGDPVKYIVNELKLKAVVHDFGSPGNGDLPMENLVLTMWYVIEHFPYIDEILKKVNTLTAMGGIFAFSTPNGRGISGRKNLKTFLNRSPEDHFTLWNPRSARRVLRRFGFKTRKIVCTGHHPERFPFMKGAAPGSIRWKTAGLISRIFSLGDTFEVYAEKIKDVNRK